MKLLEMKKKKTLKKHQPLSSTSQDILIFQIKNETPNNIKYNYIELTVVSSIFPFIRVMVKPSFV